MPVYSTEGGWLHLSQRALVEQTLAAREAGFLGAKIKVGKPQLADDIERLHAVREAAGAHFALMIDANQCFTASEAVRRAAHFSGLGLGWFEEPLPADDVAGHVRLAASTHLPIAVGESLYSNCFQELGFRKSQFSRLLRLAQFKDSGAENDLLFVQVCARDQATTSDSSHQSLYRKDL